MKPVVMSLFLALWAVQAAGAEQCAFCYAVHGRVGGDSRVNPERQADLIVHDMQARTGLSTALSDRQRAALKKQFELVRTGWTYSEVVSVFYDGRFALFETQRAKPGSRSNPEHLPTSEREFVGAGVTMKRSLQGSGGLVFGIDQSNKYDGPADLLALAGCLAKNLTHIRSEPGLDQYSYVQHQYTNGVLDVYKQGKRPKFVQSTETYFGGNAKFVVRYRLSTGMPGHAGFACTRDSFIVAKGKIVASTASEIEFRCFGSKLTPAINMATFFEKGSTVTDSRLGLDKPVTYSWNGQVPDASSLVDLLSKQGTRSSAGTSAPWVPAFLVSGVTGILLASLSRKSRLSEKSSSG